MLQTYGLWTVAGEAISDFEFKIWNHGKTLEVGRMRVGSRSLQQAASATYLGRARAVLKTLGVKARGGSLRYLRG